MINMSNFDVIYNERIYKCLDMQLCFDKNTPIGENKIVEKPKFLGVVCIDENNEVIVIHDENFMFRFIRKGRVQND